MLTKRITLVALVAVTALATFCAAETAPPPKEAAKASRLETGWEEIDQRLVFLTVRLSSVETSLDAVDQAIRKTGAQQTNKKGDAERYRAGNTLMDRKAGGPVRWDDFYGDTARKFYFHSRDGAPTPKDRPPQFDYIYRANADEQKRVEQDVAALGNKIDVLTERRRQLEAEQSALWCQISFQVVASRSLAAKPLYRFNLDPTGADAARLGALRAGCDFVRAIAGTVEVMQETVDRNQAGDYAGLVKLTKQARSDLELKLVQSAPSADGSLVQTDALTKLSAAAKRLEDVSRNIDESYRLALEGDRSGDAQRKNTFRGKLQEMLVDYTETLLAADESISTLAGHWKISPDTHSPVTKPTLAIAPMTPIPTPAPAPAPATTGAAATKQTPEKSSTPEKLTAGEKAAAAGTLPAGMNRPMRHSEFDTMPSIDSPPAGMIDFSGKWSIVFGDKKPGTRDIQIDYMGNNQFRMGPHQSMPCGLYEVMQNKRLVMTARGAGYSGFVWQVRDADHLELISTQFRGATLTRVTAAMTPTPPPPSASPAPTADGEWATKQPPEKSSTTEKSPTPEQAAAQTKGTRSMTNDEHRLPPSVDPPPTGTPDLTGRWSITNSKGETKYSMDIDFMGNNQFRLEPRSMSYGGLYELRGQRLVMTARASGYSGFIWQLRDADHLELISTDARGATLTRTK